MNHRFLIYAGRILGFALILAGKALAIYVDRRAFYRRNGAGLEGFSSYSGMLKVRSYEGLLMLLRRLLLVFRSVDSRTKSV